MTHWFFENDRGPEGLLRYLTLILTTRGCSWARGKGPCLMCGYQADADPAISPEAVVAQVAGLSGQLSQAEGVKLYTSGSILDEDELPTDLRRELLARLAASPAREIVLETRADLVTQEGVAEVLATLPGKHVEFAMGLESSNDEVLAHCVHKPTRFVDVRRAAEEIRAAGAGVKLYLLLKPPFLSEGEAIDDCLESCRDAAKIADTVTINLLNVQRRTLVEKLWERNEYRPPWLWSAVEVARACQDLPVRLLMGLAGAGSRRGAYNCRRCSKHVTRALRHAALSGDYTLPGLACGCEDEWRVYRELRD